MKQMFNRTGITAQDRSGEATGSRTALDDLPIAGALLDEGALRHVAGGSETWKMVFNPKTQSPEWRYSIDTTISAKK